MKISTAQQSLDTSITSAADFGIEESDLSHIMGILRSQIYSDKLLAVIREYSTNARDANIEAGNSHRPIHIDAPTLTKPQLSFRDYGDGLTDDQVTSLYVKYGASTKRSSNDYTGCLGIGCKAAFAYGDSFTITSYTFDSITTWLARIDETKRGTISLISREPNHTEPSGVCVSVTIRSDDFGTCENKLRAFFKYWKSDITTNLEDDLTQLNAMHETDDWAIAENTSNNGFNSRYNHRGAATVVMGNIAYPVPAQEFKDNGMHGLSLIHHNNVIFYAPLGSLDIAANREALELTDRTRNGIASIASNMMLDLTNMLEKTVASQPTRILASIKSSLFERSLGVSLNRDIASKATWKGQKLIRTISMGKIGAVLHKRERSWRSSDAADRNVREKDKTMITLEDNLTICITDKTISEANSTRRVRTLQAATGYDRAKQFIVIQRDNLQYVEPSLEKADYTDLLDIEPLKAERTIIASSGDKTKQVRINVCKLTPNSMKSARLSKECEPVATRTGRFVYVPLDRFDWDGHPDRLANLSWIMDALKHINDDVSITLHGVKKHHVSKLNDKWVTLDVYYKEKLDRAIKLKPTYYKRKADEYQCWDKDTHSFFQDLIIMSKVKDKTIAHQAQTISNAGHTGGASELQVGKLLNVYENKSTIIEQIKETMIKYPLLQLITSGYYTLLKQEDIIKELNKYIQTIKSK